MKTPQLTLLAIATASLVARADPPPDLDAAITAETAAAQGDPRTRGRAERPDPASLLPRITLERYRLANGLDVVLSPDPDARQIYVEVSYRVGTGDCAAPRVSLAHLAEHLSYGATRHAPESLLVETERADATVFNGVTEVERTAYFAGAPAGSLARLLWVESERMAFALDAVTDATVANERRIVANEYRQRVANSAYGDLDLAIARELYPEGHLRRVPYDDLAAGAAITAGDVRSFLRAHYVPANARLTVVGGFDMATARAEVQRYFGDIAASPAPRRARSLERTQLARERVLRFRAPNAPAAVLVLWPTPALYEPGDAELDMIAELTTRREEGTMHHALVGAGIAAGLVVRQHSYQDTSEFIVTATVAEGHRAEEVLDVIDRELVRVRRTPFDAGRLTDAVALARRGVAGAAVSLFDRAWRLAAHPDPLDPGAFRRSLELYAAVTPESVRATAQQWLPLDRRLVVFVQPDPNAPASGVVESVRTR